MFFKYNKFHEAAYLGVASGITGKINQQYNSVEYYFQLKQTNDALVRENLQLRQQLAQNFEQPDSTTTQFIDSLVLVSPNNNEHRKYLYRSAKVLNNTITLTDNYITLHIGSNQGVKNDMGVIGPDGVVGTVINTNKNYSVVMSLLHHQSKLSAKHLKSGLTGTVFWEGTSPFELTMINIPKTEKIEIGDTIVTSQYASYRFPEGIMVGTVVDFVENTSRNFHTLKVKPATNFNKLEWSTVVENLQLEEQLAIEETTSKN